MQRGKLSMQMMETFIKYSRSFGSKRIIPEGIKKLEQLKYTHTHLDLKDIIANVDILIAAYTNIKGNKGAETPGLDNETLDGINKEAFEKIKKDIRTGAYQFKPARIVEIPKSNGGTRKLGIPCAKDKIVQEAMRMILEAIFENSFSQSSHGFRSGHSCHTALNYIRIRFAERKWYIEGDISKCFDSFDHKLLVDKIKERIKDQVFIDLLYKSLKAGYIEQGLLKIGNKGTPQGSILSPILANIYLHELDLHMEKMKIDFDKGVRSKANPEYTRLIRSKNMSKEERLRFIHKNKIFPRLPNDPCFKRLSYVRYADDFLIGIIGSKEDCLTVRDSIKVFLENNLKLILNMEKTKITNSSTERAKFLGYEIHSTSINKRPFIKVSRMRAGKLNTITEVKNSRPLFSIPIDRLKEKLYEKGYTKDKKEGTRVGRLIHNTDLYIIEHFSALWRGIANYYSKATNFSRLSSIYYILTYSCLLTLVSKNKLRTKRKGVIKYGMPMKVGETQFPKWGKPLPKTKVEIYNIERSERTNKPKNSKNYR